MDNIKIRCWNCENEYVVCHNEPCHSCDDMRSNFELKRWMSYDILVNSDILKSSQ